MMCSVLARDERRECDSHLCVSRCYMALLLLSGGRGDTNSFSVQMVQQQAVFIWTSRGQYHTKLSHSEVSAFHLDRCHYSSSPETKWENIPSQRPTTARIPHIFTCSLSYFTSFLSSSASLPLGLVLPLCSSQFIMASSLAVVLLIGANGWRRPGWVGVCDSFRQAGSKLCKQPLVIHDSVQHPRASINPGIGAFFLSITHLPLFSPFSPFSSLLPSSPLFSSRCFVISLHLHLYSPLPPASSPLNSFSLGLSTVVQAANPRQTEGQLVYTPGLMYADEEPERFSS